MRNYFTDKELACPHCGKVDMDSEFMTRANQARHYAGIPFIVNSAYRCPEHNESEAVGGSPTSSHVKGMAMDVKCKNSWEMFRIIDGLFHAGFKRIMPYVIPATKHRYDPVHIHFDSDGEKAQDVFRVRTYKT